MVIFFSYYNYVRFCSTGSWVQNLACQPMVGPLHTLKATCLVCTPLIGTNWSVHLSFFVQKIIKIKGYFLNMVFFFKNDHIPFLWNKTSPYNSMKVKLFEHSTTYLIFFPNGIKQQWRHWHRTEKCEGLTSEIISVGGKVTLSVKCKGATYTFPIS